MAKVRRKNRRVRVREVLAQLEEKALRGMRRANRVSFESQDALTRMRGDARWHKHCRIAYALRYAIERLGGARRPCRVE